jgi:hypothetical protein
MPRKAKRDRLSYLITSIQAQAIGDVNQIDSFDSPAAYFLTQVVNLNKSLRYCMEKFPAKGKTDSGSGYKSIDKLPPEAQNVIRRLSASAFVAMMGHFETFQRSFVSDLFEATRFIRNLNVEILMKRILGESKDNGIRIVDMAAYRGQTASIGRLLVDNIVGWHNPQRVNEIVKAMLEKTEFYSNADIEYLNCLWQIRHAITHTGGWLTLSDAQKVPQLKSLGNEPIYFDHNFIRQVHEEFHQIVKNSVDRASEAFRKKIEADYEEDEQEKDTILQGKEILKLFTVTSPRQSELRD